MNIGMTLPVMEANLDRATLKAWCETIDAGPWASLALGERIAFVNPEFLTTLAAAAAWTNRVELVATISVAALHAPNVLAKQFATIDMLSNGRLTVGVGTGGREEDYRAANTDWKRHTLAALQEQVEAMQAVWRGDVPEGLPRRIGPRPARGDIPVLAGALGPKGIARAARYSQGLCGFSFGASVDDIQNTFTLADNAWQEAGRTDKPRKMTSFWFAVGEPDKAREQVNAHLRHYLTWLPKDLVEAMLPTSGFAGTLEQLKERLAELRDIGTDDIVLVPTSRDAAQLKTLEALF